MSSSTFFTNSSICFENKQIDNLNIDGPENLNAYFGIVTLNAVTAPCTENEQDIVFMVDCSGSMSDKCADNKTKMQHILHTLQNMITYFHERPFIKVHITVMAFDDKIYNIVNRTDINDKNLVSILEKIDDIRPKNGTNIELALTHVNDYVLKLKADYPNNNISHIFMTDGEATMGSKEHAILKGLVDPDICNAFIGFGIRHDSQLLNAISNNKNSGYYFIDAIENSGLVYGEILHGILFKLLNNVVITVKDGLIYEYKTNSWTDKLSIVPIVSECQKIYHIVSFVPDDCGVTLKSNTEVSGSEVLVELSRADDADLTKYIYRQRTLQMLYKANQFQMRSYSREEVQQRRLIKEDLRSFIDEMKQYMAENGLNDDNFFKNLCDDIYICYTTLGTYYGSMYTSARQTSQGTQRCYTVSQTPGHTFEDDIELDDDFMLPPMSRINRQVTGFDTSFGTNADTHTQPLYDYDQEYDEDYDLPPIPPRLVHEVSTFAQTPYLNNSATQVMYSINGGSASQDTVEE